MDRKYKPILLPNIEFKINNKLSNLNLMPKTSVDWAIEHNDLVYKSICVNSQGDNFFLKANLINQKHKKIKEFLREIFFYKSLSDFKTDENFPNYGISKYINSGREKDFYWLLRDYTEGEKMGNWFSFSEKFLNNAYLNIFIDYVNFIQLLYLKISSSKIKFNFSELPRKDYNWLINEIDNLKPILINVLGKTAFQSIVKEIEKNKKLLNDSCEYLIHRDNHPENFIVIKEKKKVFLIDWTDISIGNYVYDFADIWVHAWENSYWQKMFLEKILKNAKNRKETFLLFRILLFYLLAIEIKNVSDNHLLSFAVKKEDMKKFQQNAINSHSKTLNYIYRSFKK